MPISERAATGADGARSECDVGPRGRKSNSAVGIANFAAQWLGEIRGAFAVRADESER